MPAGRPTKLTPELLEKAREYAMEGYKEQDQVVPSLVGMALALNVAESTLYNWTDPENSTFSAELLGTLQECKARQHMVALNGGLSGDFNAAITKLLLHNHGYSEKQEQTLQGPDGGPIEMDMKWEVEVIDARDD